MRNKTVICLCGKHCYPSEAAANRAKQKYEDILRVYPCYDLGQEYWHTTSEEYKEGYFSRNELNKYAGKKKINSRIKHLKQKIDEQNR